MQLEIEEAALKKETDKRAGDRLEDAAQGARRPAFEQTEAMQRPVGGREGRDRSELQGLRFASRSRRSRRTTSRRRSASYDLNRAAELQATASFPELERRLDAEPSALWPERGGDRLLREEVTEDEIAEIVSQLDRHSRSRG